MDNRCLLVVDDDPHTTYLLQVLLRRGGYETRASNSGEEALDLARREPPAAVLLDLHMPDLSGLEVLATLKNDRRLRDVPVIVTTGDLTAQVAEAFAMLTKPFDVPRLYDAVSSALSAC